MNPLEMLEDDGAARAKRRLVARESYLKAEYEDRYTRVQHMR